MATAPTIRAAINGGMARPRRGNAVSARNTAVIGAAIASASRKASTRSMPKRRNTPATIAMTIGIGTACIARRTPAREPEEQHQHAGHEIRADRLPEADMRERRTEEHGAGNAPQEHERLPVGRRKGKRDDRIEAKSGRNPGRNVGFGKTAARADRQDDRNRTGAREKKGDEGARAIERAEVGGNASRAYERQYDTFERHVVRLVAAKIGR